MENHCTINKPDHSLHGLKGFVLRRGAGDMAHMVKIGLFVPTSISTYQWQTWWFLLSEAEEELARA